MSGNRKNENISFNMCNVFYIVNITVHDILINAIHFDNVLLQYKKKNSHGSFLKRSLNTEYNFVGCRRSCT